MKTPKDNGGGTPPRAATAAFGAQGGRDDPSPHRERVTGRLCAFLREAEGDAA